MMNAFFQRVVAAFLIVAMFTPPLLVSESPVESFENKSVGKITVIMESPNCPLDADSIRTRMGTKEGDPFHQLTFDNDLKMLAEDYDRVVPSIDVVGDQLLITIRVWAKPTIQRIDWIGNERIKTKTLAKELGVGPGAIYDRDTFNQGFTKIKELYVKKGYFEMTGSYTIYNEDNDNNVVIEINIDEGRSGRISKIELEGFTDSEKKELLRMMVTKKYYFMISWVTGTGIYKEDMVEHDRLVIADYLHNKGYADATVQISFDEDPLDPKRVIVYVKADRGELYHFDDITFSGNSIFSDEEIRSIMVAKEGNVFSPQAMRQTAQNIKDLYGHKGYIEANATYIPRPSHFGNTYDVHYEITEGEQYRVGLIRVQGNVSTETRVILHQTRLVPGEIFDTNKLKATEYRLMGTGYFKCVNVYPAQSQYDSELGSNYRDIIIEVEETQTGNMSLFFGASAVDQVYGGLELSESNFNHKGLTRFWKDGFSSLRGGGEIASGKVQIGKKSRTYTLNWMEPHFRDTNWRIGLEGNYTHSTTVSDNIDVDNAGGTFFASYPLSGYWSTALKFRVRNSVVEVSGSGRPKPKRDDNGNITNQDDIDNWNEQKQKQERNSGLVFGIGPSFTFDSTDKPFKPHMGARSVISTEICLARRHESTQRTIPFIKAEYLNTYYHPLTARSTFKLRGDFKYLNTFGANPLSLPYPERYFMGGQNSVRGYEQFSIGPVFSGDINDVRNKNDIDPTGGAISALFSTEYLYEVFPPFLDLFVFVDGGGVTESRHQFPHLRFSVGGGARIDIAGKLPLVLGYGYPLNPENRDIQQEGFFFAMGAQF